jgi:DNA-binding MarR family transcriptional regulator
MKRKKDDFDEMVKRHLPPPPKKEVKEARDRFSLLLKRRSELEDAIADFRKVLGKPEVEPLPLAYVFQLVLAAVYFFKGKGSTVEIAAKVRELGSLSLDPAAILVSLDRLERQRLLSSHKTAPDSKVYTVTPKGERMLAKVRASAKRMVDALKGIPDAG